MQSMVFAVIAAVVIWQGVVNDVFTHEGKGFYRCGEVFLADGGHVTRTAPCK